MRSVLVPHVESTVPRTVPVAVFIDQCDGDFVMM
jgi:hypothetical protein